ncbi:MAG: LemA family protein [Candidatus Melainabacteria bacterium]|nr:LemA family protein [Candidatus Melainabacteria bacterium]
MRQSILQTWAETEARLKKRHEIIAGLLDLVKNSLGHDLVARLSHAHKLAGSMSGPCTVQRASCEEELSESLGLVFHQLQETQVVSDSDSYIRLRDEVVSIEDEITLFKDKYNDFVVRYSARLKVFPESFIAAKAKLIAFEEFQIRDAFAKYPLKLKPTYPTPRKSFPGLEESKAD